MQELTARLGRLVHRFRVAGAPLVLDVAGGAAALLDEAAWDVLPYALRGEAVPEGIVGSHGAAECLSAYDEIAGLKSDGFFLGHDPLDDSGRGGGPAVQPGLKALCLYVSDACNMRCRYCFASGAAYGSGGARPASPMLMPREAAFRSVDFLFENRGRRGGVDIDFFGGEPLLNWETVTETIEYARARGRAEGVRVDLTLTTNGTLLTKEVCDHLNDAAVNVVVSIDGRPEVHDAMRPLANGGPSYEESLRGARMLVDSRKAGAGGAYTYVRGTYTHGNLHFAEDVLHLVDLGFECVSVEPVVCADGHPCAITRGDVPILLGEYERLAVEYVRRARSGRPFRFFHFEMDLAGGPCAARRMSGCGAGRDYLAVATDGSIYPCHQFIGRRGTRLGDVWRGIVEPGLRGLFNAAGVASKAKCRDCWARYACGGGCHANAHLANGTIDEPYDVGCELQKRRIECAIYTRAMLGLR